MKVFIGLNSHSNKVSLPLRFGVSLTEQHQQFATLSNPVFDPTTTESQRPDEIARMRKHYSGCLVVPHASGSAAEAYALDCRIVLELPADDSRVPAVITVLSISSTKGDATVTRHLEGMLKKGRISKQDLLDVFHPAYVQGKIADSTDCEEIFREHLEQSTPAVDAGDNLGQQVVVSAEPVVRLVEAIADSQAEALEGPPRFSAEVPLRTKYQYVFADAYLRDVWLAEGRIHVKCIGSNGDEVTLQSFSARPHLAEHHQRAYEYLSDRKEQRAVFAVCVSSPYKGVLAESVTSISLQLMKTSLARAERTSTVPATGPAMNSIARSRTWEADAAELFFEGNPSLMTDDEFEMIYGYER